VGRTFTEELVKSWATAFAAYSKKRFGHATIVIGRDARQSGEWAEKVSAESITDHGADAIKLGVATTPTIEVAVTKHSAQGGIIISASHNPVEWNGLKFVGPDGVFLNEQEIEALKAEVREQEIADVKGKTSYDENAAQNHVEKVISTLPINIEAIRGRKFKVCLDPVNSAGAIAVPILLDKLGCDITMVNGEVNGLFSHNPEPRPENLTQLAAAIKDKQSDIGIAVDPDADRLALIDEKGAAISEEYTLALALLTILSKKTGSVAANLSTSRMIDDVAKMFSVQVVRTAVGERNVVEGMRVNHAVAGGEGNGGVIFPACHEGRDSLVGIALILDLMATQKKKLSELVNSIPKYNMVKEKFPRSGVFNKEDLRKKLIATFPNAQVSTIDGIRVDIEGGWTHIRPSNTEPIVRIITEAASEEVFNILTSEAKKALTS